MGPGDRQATTWTKRKEKKAIKKAVREAEKQSASEAQRHDFAEGSSCASAPSLHPQAASGLRRTDADVIRGKFGRKSGRISPEASDTSLGPRSTSSAEGKKKGYIRRKLSGLLLGGSRDKRADSASPTQRSAQPSERGVSPGFTQEVQHPFTQSYLLEFTKAVRLRNFRAHQKHLNDTISGWDRWKKDVEIGKILAEEGNCLFDAQLFSDVAANTFLNWENERDLFKDIYKFDPREVKSMNPTNELIDAINKHGTVMFAYYRKELDYKDVKDFSDELDKLRACLDKGAGPNEESQEMMNKLDEEYLRLRHEATSEQDRKAEAERDRLYGKMHRHHECKCMMEEHVEDYWPSDRSRRTTPAVEAL